MTHGSNRRVALITGAAGGLGSAVVPVFKSAGYDVVGCDAAHPDEKMRFDVTDRVAVEAGLDGILADRGHIDVLVNLVGAWRPQSPVSEISDEDWDGLFDVNFKSVLVMSRAVLPHMIQRGAGRIINVGAKQGQHGVAGNGPYSVAKAGVLALTEVMADEVRDSGITVNAVIPSIIDTPGNRAGMPDADFGAWVPPDQLAAIMVFLASEEAASISGDRIQVFNRA
ncbi:MAG: SDR family NAD(P)-dependent oxidoreductase [Chloroflexi bacterium]|nr:SDR family NAD(P)-dependent oxidoreductase [Chloroflexota bacterium]